VSNYKINLQAEIEALQRPLGTKNMKKLTKKQQKQLKELGINAIKFTAPLMAIFFAQLASGTDIQQAGLVALYALYALLSDTFKKLG
jgi:membrane protein insertase Oxa1/YidC/SpoIIIJ